MNANDTARRQILSWFYDRNSNATSHKGKKGSAVKISDVKRGLKQQFELSQTDVMSNLTYLIDKGWINKTEVQKQVRLPRGTIVPATQTWYEISSPGIDKIEGESDFQNSPHFSGINISSIGTNVITLGSGNIVNARVSDLQRELSSLQEIVVKSSLDEEQKLDIKGDIECINDQLAKSHPDATVLARLWDRISQVATAGGFLSAVERIVPLIEPLITGGG